MKTDTLQEQPHRRWNPLREEWVLVSPQRTQRPWQGQTEERPQVVAAHDPKCYLCPGNQRANGNTNPSYTGTFVFDNDFSALRPDSPVFSIDESSRGLLRAESESGSCRVVCFSPQHNLSLPQMSKEKIGDVIDTWSAQYSELGASDKISYVQIFENRGSVMGCSNPHPHGQIWASSTIPNEPQTETRALAKYLAEKGSCLLCDYLALEREREERVICSNDHFTAVVPFWAVWPFETLLLSHRHFGSFPTMSRMERLALADILKRLTTRYDNLFQVSFPYSMGFHQSPTDGAAHSEQHFHAHFYPPLLRSATIRKFMVGYEMLATPQRDIAAESAADKLRQVSETHYSLSYIADSC